MTTNSPDGGQHPAAGQQAGSDPARPQLTLDLYRDVRAEFDTYVVDTNTEAVAALKRWSAGDGPPQVYLWGRAGSGRSHLLQAAISAAAAGGRRAMYLPLATVRGSGPGVLAGLEQLDVLALDDLDAVAATADWEQALFHLYNRMQQRGARLLVAAAAKPADAGIALPDLRSRLGAALVYYLQEAGEAAKAQILAMRAAERGLHLSAAVTDFIMRRERRDLRTLIALLAVLDAASLHDRRALTVPFVRAVLAERAALDG